MASNTFLRKLHQPVHSWIGALVLVITGMLAIGVLVLAAQPPNQRSFAASPRLPHRFLCNDVQRGNVTLTPGLAAWLFCSSPLRSLWYDLTQPKRPPTQVTQEYQPLPTATPTPLPHTTYTSDKLGISFTYIPTFPNGIGQHFFTKEIGNTVHLYWAPGINHPFSGSDEEFLKTIAGGAYSVEVFHKDPQQSLQEAIKQQFLTGYAETDCFVKATRYGHPREDEAYETAVITIPPRDPTDTYAQVSAKLAKCPAEYTNADRGVSYFLMDPKHPDKLLFVRVGQSDIPSGVGSMWDGTIKVLDD